MFYHYFHNSSIVHYILTFIRYCINKNHLILMFDTLLWYSALDGSSVDWPNSVFLACGCVVPKVVDLMTKGDEKSSWEEEFEGRFDCWEEDRKVRCLRCYLPKWWKLSLSNLKNYKRIRNFAGVSGMRWMMNGWRERGGWKDGWEYGWVCENKKSEIRKKSIRILNGRINMKKGDGRLMEW